MKIKTVEIHNFLGIKYGLIDLKDIGLCAIQGINLSDPSADSNGAGKSTILDAISWCFYAVTARGVSGDFVINTKAGKDCCVVTTVEDENDEYVISRGRKHKVLKNNATVFFGKKDLTCGTDKLTQELINKIIGCEEQVFNSSVYAGQEKMPDLPNMTDKFLKSLIEEAAGINKLQTASTIAGQKLAKERAVLEQLGNKAQSETENSQRLRARIEEIDANEETRKSDIQERIAALEADIKKAESSITKSIDFALEESQLLKEQEKLRDALLEKDREEQVLRSLIAEENKAEKELASKTALKDALFVEIKRDKEKHNKISEVVGTACPSCGKERCEEDLSEVRALSKQNILEKAERYNVLKQQVEDAQNALGLAFKARCDFETRMTDTSKTVALQGELDARLNVIRTARQSHENIKNHIQSLKDKLVHETKALSESPYSAMRETAVESLKKLKEELKELHDKALKQSDKVSLLENAVEVFGRAGVRAEILDTVTPYLNAKTAEYLTALTDGKISAVWTTLVANAKGELKEKFTIEVEKEGGASTFKGLSGGEKRKVRLATTLALQDLTATRASKPIDFRFLDEVDTALDDSGVERLMELMKEKAKDVGTLLIISHANFSDVVSRIITVTNDGNGAIVE